MFVKWFPAEFSQSRLGCSHKQSYACSLISLLNAEECSRIGGGHPDVEGLTRVLEMSIINGNFISESAETRRHDTLNVPEAIHLLRARAPREFTSRLFNFCCGACLHQETRKLCDSWARSAIKTRHLEATYLVLIAANRTVLIVVGKAEVSLVDSHRHGSRGACIARAPIDQLGRLSCWYHKILSKSLDCKGEQAELSLLYFPKD